MIKTEVIPHLEDGLIANAKLKKKVRKTQTCFVNKNDEKFKKINHLIDRIVDNHGTMIWTTPYNISAPTPQSMDKSDGLKEVCVEPAKISPKAPP